MADLKDIKIKESDLQKIKVEAMDNRPSERKDMTPEKIKQWFDNVPVKLLAMDKFNALIDVLTAAVGTPGAAQISARNICKHNIWSDVQTVLKSLYDDILARVSTTTTSSGDNNKVGLRSKVESMGDAVKLTVENITEQNPAYKHGLYGTNKTAGMVEGGHSYDYWADPFPRPFTQKTIDRLNQTNEVKDSLVAGLKRQGINAK